MSQCCAGSLLLNHLAREKITREVSRRCGDAAHRAANQVLGQDMTVFMKTMAVFHTNPFVPR